MLCAVFEIDPTRLVVNIGALTAGGGRCRQFSDGSRFASGASRRKRQAVKNDR